jgi:hypothetical protein
LDAWILEKYPSKSDYQKIDKLRIHFGDRVIDIATKATSDIVNNLNPLWNPVPPSRKSISDMLRAIKLHRFRAKAHQNAIQSMRKQDGYLTGTFERLWMPSLRNMIQQQNILSIGLFFYYVVIQLIISLVGDYL